MASLRWQVRNANARAKGYKSYYDYRAHDYGRIAPSLPRLSGERLRKARGHTGYSDLLQQVRAGRVEILSQTPGERDSASGQYSDVTVDVVLTDGSQRSYTLRGKDLRGDRIDTLRGAVSAAGSDIYTNPSLDILDLTGVDNALLAEDIAAQYADYDPDDAIDDEGDE